MKGAKEFTGRNLDEAIEAACNYYDLPREKLEIEIVNDAKSGIFGLVGAKKATVLAKQASMANYDLSARDEESDEKPKNERSQPRQRQPRSQSQAQSSEKRPRRNEGNAPQQTSNPAADADSTRESAPAFSEEADAERSAPAARSSERTSDRGGERDRGGRGRSRSGNSRPRGRSSERNEAREGEGQRSSRSSQRDGRRDGRRSPGKPDHVQAFEAELPFEQGSPAGANDQFDAHEFAVDFETQSNLKSIDDIDQDKAMELVQSSLQELLKPICSAPEIKVAVEDGRIEASINCEDESGLIIGREGQTLAALQYMVSRIISRQMEAAIHVHLDTGDYKERQDQKLKELALRLAERARESGRTQYTRPLSSYHRRIVHMVLQEEQNIETRSRGDGAMKRVYIFMRQARS